MINDKEYRKTNLSRRIEEITGAFSDIDYSLGLILLSSSLCGLLEDMICLISLLHTINYEIKNLYNKPISKIDPEIINFEKKTILTGKSDLEPLINICNSFKKYFQSNKIFYLEREIPYLHNIYNIISDIYSKSDINIISTSREITDGFKFDQENIDILKNIKNKGRLNLTNGFEEWLMKSTFIKNYFFIDFKKKNISNFCQIFNFDTSIIEKYIKHIIDLKLKLYCIDYNQDPELKTINSFVWAKELENNFKISFGKLTYIDKIINLFLIGYTQNVCLKNNNSKKDYYRIISNEKRILNIIPNISFDGRVQSYLSNNTSIIFYLKLMKGEISIISNIKEENLVNINPLFYNPDNIRKYGLDNNTLYNSFQRNITNYFNINNILWNNKKLLPFINTQLDIIQKKI